MKKECSITELECPVCLESLKNTENISCNQCRKSIHRNCCILSGKSLCPMCRTPYILDTMTQQAIRNTSERYIKEETLVNIVNILNDNRINISSDKISIL